MEAEGKKRDRGVSHFESVECTCGDPHSPSLRPEMAEYGKNTDLSDEMRERLRKLHLRAREGKYPLLPVSHLSDSVKVSYYPSPVSSRNPKIRFRHTEEHVLAEIHHHRKPGCMQSFADLWGWMPTGYVYAGPRQQVVFRSEDVKAAIVTCGGLCPGLNSVVCEIVRSLEDSYGVREIYGIAYGYRGFYSSEWKKLDVKKVEGLHKMGGTVLGTSRGGYDTEKIIEALQKNGCNMVFAIGGDGTQRGAMALQEEIEKRKLKISIIGIPKTIDNDIGLLDKTFGFETAVEEAAVFLERAAVEASSVMNGIGLVKLMGRSTGFVAAQATAGAGCVDLCLIPESPFTLEGENGIFNFIKRSLLRNGDCVIVIAESAGIENLPSTGEQDGSGNPTLPDNGLWLKKQIQDHFRKENFPTKTFYIDPSYLIRSVPPNPSDRLYCTMLAHMAVHASFAGFTGCVVGLVHNTYVYLPMAAVAAEPRRVKVDSNMWQRVLEATGQPDFY